MEEPLEIPIVNDLTMVLGSISQVFYFNCNSNQLIFRYPFHSSFLGVLTDGNLNVLCFQSKAIAVVVDFTDPSTVYDNVKQVSSLNQR